jgi:hypothetical protein
LGFNPDSVIKSTVRANPDWGSTRRAKNDHTNIKKFFKPSCGVVFTDPGALREQNKPGIGLGLGNESSSIAVLKGMSFRDLKHEDGAKRATMQDYRNNISGLQQNMSSRKAEDMRLLKEKLKMNS